MRRWSLRATPNRSTYWRWGLVTLMVVACQAAGWAAEPPAEFSAEQLEFFEKQVRPLLVEHCFECHSGEDEERTKGGLRLDSRGGALAGGDTGPAIVPAKPDDSLLIDAVRYGDLYQMPPKSKLPEADIEVLTRWVAQGAPWTPGGSSSERAAPEWDLEALKQSHWAWRPLAKPELPRTADSVWPRDSLDHFVLSKLEQQGLTPAEPAPPAVWLRRVHLDLIGLPPTAEEVLAFEANPTPEAYEAAVDRLLRSPHFGERWGRHWLDLVRYAESRGHEFDYDAANAYQYRDYVIRALNADVPYDQFMVEHVAGDLLNEPRRHPTEGFNESILATGFWFLGEWVHSPVDIRKDECDRFDNMVDVFSKTFLGLTVACARCHDHKFDAIAQRDYYALFGYLQSTAYRQVRFDTLDNNRRIAQQLAALDRATGASLAQAWYDAAQPVAQRLADYLLAARQAIQSVDGSAARPADGAAAELPAAELENVIAKLARDRDLKGPVLARWVAHLLRAANEPNDPLWLAAQGLSKPSVSAGVTAPGDWRSKLAHAPLPPDADVVIDYSSAGATWLADGYAFGLGPVPPGQWLGPAATATSPLSVALFGAARRDPAFHGLTLADGTVGEPGRLGAHPRSGQTLRTPTFEIGSGKVHYLVRGTGIAYAAVDSHTLINGPLHGSLVIDLKPASNAADWHWITHDLTRYAGHRAHVEFTPVGEEPLDLFMVVQSAETPPLPTASAAAVVAEHLSGDGGVTAEQLAIAYQRFFSEQANRWRSEERGGQAIGVAEAALFNWMLQRADLWGVDASELAAPQLAQYQAARDRLKSSVQRTSRTAPAMWEGSGEDEHILIRGNPRTVGAIAPRGMLLAITGEPAPIDHGSGRLQLARQLTDPANPFPARVRVNRVWHHLIGRGIVASTDNFGVLGEAPTHPELLDHLATTFIADGWSLKRLIRRIVLSSTYRMSSSVRPEAADRDPQNRWLHRMNIRRLEGEAIRDSLLSVAGRLNPAMYGPSVPVYLTPFMQGRGRPQSGPLDGAGRRSIYIAVRRNFLSPMMLAFDTPQPFSSVGRRSVSNVPAQALILLNDPLVKELADSWAQRTLADSPASVDEAVQQMYLTAFARRATDEELSAAREFLAAAAAARDRPANQLLELADAWADLAHVLFNVKEFIFVL